MLTLLSENVLANGSFYSRFYYNPDGVGVALRPGHKGYYQNYSVSTVRMWLNSDFTQPHDGGVAFDPNSAKPAYRGFLSEAFSDSERNIIINREISASVGFTIHDSTSSHFETYPAVMDKVWIPAYSEIFGKFDSQYGVIQDATAINQFKYFQGSNNLIDNLKLEAKCTPFSSTQSKSNYVTINDALHMQNIENVLPGEISPRSWMTRSPSPSFYPYIIGITQKGATYQNHTDNSFSAIRPAICIPE